MSDFESFIDLIKSESESDGEIEKKFRIEYLEMRDDLFGWTPLHYACRYGRVGLVKILIDNKCDINVSTNNGYQSIHFACLHGHIDIVKILIVNKCDINVSNKNGSQPIHFACMNGHIHIVEILIDNKCNTKALTKDGKSPIDIARLMGHQQIIDIIMNSGADPIESIIRSMNLQCTINCNHKFCRETLNQEKLPEGKLIGSGAFGKVYKYQISNTDVKFVIKQIKDVGEDKKNIERNINKFSSQIIHKNIVRYFGALEKSGKLCIFMEYISGVSLKDLINKAGMIETNKVIQYSKQILVGLQFLHSKAIIHRDIKPANILLDRDETVKLSDFGVSRSLPKILSEIKEKVRTFSGTINYMAPEVILDEAYDYPADIWSTGATVIHMITGETPYDKLEPVATVSKIQNTKKIEVTTRQPISKTMQSFIDDLLNPDQSKRPRAEVLLTHSIFNN